MVSMKTALGRITPASTPQQRKSPSPSPPSSADGTEKYLLRVTTGPAYDEATHKIVSVNGAEPTCFDSEDMIVKVRVRIRDYKGLPRGSPETSPYFSDPEHKHDQYSVAFSFVPKHTIPSENLVWGNDLDHPIRDRLPPGFNTGFKIVKQFIDPGLECDVQADQPWMYGPALSCWFKLRIGDKVPADHAKVMKNDKDDILVEGADGSGIEVRVAKGLPEPAEKRRKFFLDRDNRKHFEFEEGRLYEGDFHNPYLDFSNYAVKLPGFSLGVLRYIGDKTHQLRYVFKDRETGKVYFVVCITLLFGQQLHDVLAQEQKDASISGQPAAGDVD